MNIVVNGEEHVVTDGITVSMLLQELEIFNGRVAVERNREIVPRSRLGELGLQEGDCLEIVHFVGGG